MARTRPRRSGKKIDNLVWTSAQAKISALAAGSSAVNVIGVSAINRPVTIMRTRGHVDVFIDGAQAPGGSMTATWGLIVVPEGSGSTVQYNPVADDNADWFGYGQASLAYEEMVTDVIAVQEMLAIRFPVDIKAMRRLGPAEEVQFVMENTTQTSAVAINALGAFRFLLGF